MPWTQADVKKHKKDLNTEQEKLWVKVANKEYNACLAKGGSDKTCAPKAIIIANKVVDGISEKKWMSDEYQRKLGEKMENQMRNTDMTIEQLTEALLQEPYPNEHAARIASPDKFDKFRRQNDKFGAGINVIWGITSDGKTEIQAIRFDKDKFSVEDARKWLTDHEYKPIEFEPASSESLKPQEEALTDIIPLDEVEKSFDIPIKIIQPGWGSSGYYSETLLKSSAGKYKAGTLMFWDHPTESEEHDRPERSLRDLAGVLASDGVYKEDGKAGPGIYALCKPFPEFKGNIEAMGKYIGLSHRAMGTRKMGEAEGKKGSIIENIAQVASVDFVTVPGAGGQVVQLFESAKNGGARENLNKQEVEMEEKLKEVQEKLTATETALAEAKQGKEDVEKKLADSDAKLKEVAQRENAEKVSGIVKSVLDEAKDLPEAAKKRIRVEPIMKEDGSLDEEAVKKSATDQIIAERNYLAEIKEAGKVKDAGNTGASDEDAKKQLKESFKAKYLREGKPEAVAEQMADIAVNRK